MTTRIPSLEYSNERQRRISFALVWVVLSVAPYMFYFGLVGYSYIRFGHRPLLGAPSQGDHFQSEIQLVLPFLIILAPIASFLLFVSVMKPRGSRFVWLAAGMFTLVNATSLWFLFSMDPYGAADWVWD